MALMTISFGLSCSNADLEELQIDEDSFDSLVGKPLSIEVFGVPRISMVDSLIVSINQNGRRIFSVIDPQQEKVILEYGILDDYPEEFRFPVFTSEQYPKTPNFLPIHDVDKNEYFEFYLSSDGFELMNKQNLSDIGDFYPNQLGFKSDSLTVFSPEFGSLLIFFDHINGKSTMVDYFPKPAFDIRDQNKWMSYQAAMAVNFDKNLVAYNPLLFGELDFYDLKGNLVYRSIYDISNHLSPEFSHENLTNTNLKRFGIDMQVTSESIFVLVEGNTFQDIRMKNGIKNSKILEFDWQGRFKKGYLLDRPILSIAYDSENQVMYGISLVREEEVIIKYRLKT